MSSGQIILITGANRGIGRGLVAAFLQEPSTTVIAAVRDPSKASSTGLTELPRATGSRIIVAKIDAADESAAEAAVSGLRTDHSIDSLDVVVANAGINHSGGHVIRNSTQTIHDHFAVNTVGPLTLFQATAPLLRSSKSGRPRFIAISSNTGSISEMDIMQGLSTTSPYGASKAALNWFMRRIHFDEGWLTTLVINPGFVLTDMVAETMRGYPVKPEDLGAITVEESATGIVERIKTAKRDVSGTFQNFDGNPISW
ncbi:Short-chain dehydrogenase [Fusarium falciforme]|uniref:Short-chain dehydrogenase n=1 Tax=Fusarium falciforme TaxID=195108 RepID=UPI002301CD97|nr:Short-chain dehydrogenase [Fusarium falciforme]WAO91696.1 Short-chain dehydrogenase [Fusarium falciforme]